MYFFSKIPPSVLKMSKLESLYIGRNKIKRLPRHLPKLFPCLTALGISNNPIVYLPTEIASMSQLRNVFADNMWTRPELWKTCNTALQVQNWFFALKKNNLASDRRRAAVIALLAARKFRSTDHFFLSWVPRDLVVQIAKMVMYHSSLKDWEPIDESLGSNEYNVTASALMALAEELEKHKQSSSTEPYFDLLVRFFHGDGRNN